MRTAILILSLLLLAACETDKPAGAPPPGGAGKEAAPAPAAGAPDAKGRSPFVHCIDLIREKRYPEALIVCRAAQEADPNDAQIKKAIEIAERGGEGAE